uniref:Uncharacterized protein n=1 Tax=Siphoviridae sp. ct58A13 TaxID=2826291 RepID=A0A8S5NQH8_9CAUD|nr:MAG TPA: hypothetical protein [Siphoviridae sp. ct58A13]DAS37444.1 MAG TPA: hypothetical protein [Caudoviricetes sp.]
MLTPSLTRRRRPVRVPLDIPIIEKDPQAYARGSF